MVQFRESNIKLVQLSIKFDLTNHKVESIKFLESKFFKKNLQGQCHFVSFSCSFIIILKNRT